MTSLRRNDPDALSTALTYTRVSEDDVAREGLSLPVQLAECRRYAAHKGWVLGTEYQDVMRGTRDDRPDYQRLLADVRTLRAQGQAVVVVAALDRFGRRLLERIRSREELKTLGVTVHSVREGGEVSDLVANILGSVAQEEVRRLGERVSAVRQHTAGSGWYYPGSNPWGYRLRDATPDERSTGSPRSVLDVDQERAPYVREAFEMALKAASVSRVARWAQGLPASVRDGRRFGPAATRNLLANPVYAARPYEGAADVLARPVARWPALVDDETFARVQERIAEFAHLRRRPSNRYLLTGVIRCPRCGWRMCGSASRGQRPRYQCRGHVYGAAAPDPSCAGTAEASAVEQAALGQVVPVVIRVASSNRTLQARLRRAWQRLFDAEHADDAAPRVRQLERSAEKQRERLRKAARMLVDDDIDRQGYELLRDEARTELEAIEAELGRLRDRAPAVILPDFDTVLAETGGWDAALRGPDVAEQRRVIAAFIARVVPVRLAQSRYEARIDWTPLGAALRAACEAAIATDVA